MPAPLVLHVFPSFAVGGAQIRFAALANRFGPRWRHAVVALDGVEACRSRLAPGLDVTFPAVLTRKGDTLGNIRRARQLLRSLRPAALVTSNWGAIEWAMANIPPITRHIHTEDGFGPEERDRQLPRRVWTRRLVLRRSPVVLPSRTLLDIATNQWRLPAARLHYIPNGVDIRRFAPAADRPPGQVIGTVAALRPEKNLARLLRAFQTLPPPARLVIVGDGGERARLHALAAELGIAGRVEFTGPCADPERLYAGFDIFALASDTEQMPLSVLEAMAAGLPVVSTDVGDVRHMLAPANAIAVVPLQDAALAAALRSQLAAPGLRAELGAANRAKAVRDYDQEVMFQAYAALIGPAHADTH